MIVPAYNEAASIGETVRSLRTQTTPPIRIIVIDDCSTDDTAAVALSAGAEVVTPPSNTGSKAGAQNFVLGLVATAFTMAVDADTTLAPDALEKLCEPFVDDPFLAAACGSVIPRHVDTVWERGRYVEYMYSFTFPKQVQDGYGYPLISSGCFSMYRTDVLRQVGGWQTRTLAEDMDLTWTIYEAGRRVRFVAEAVCYPIEPHSFGFLAKQLRRWSHGFVQNVRLHWSGTSRLPYLRSVVALAMFDSVVAPLAFFLVLPVLAVLVSPWFLVAYVMDLPVVAVPVLVGAARYGHMAKALVSLPAYLLLRLVNAAFVAEAFVSEIVLDRRLCVYEKGH